LDIFIVVDPTYETTDISTRGTDHAVYAELTV